MGPKRGLNAREKHADAKHEESRDVAPAHLSSGEDDEQLVSVDVISKSIPRRDD